MSEILKVRDYIKQTAPSTDASRGEIRALREAHAAKRPLPRGVAQESVEVGGVGAEKHVPGASDTSRAIIHLHGGG